MKLLNNILKKFNLLIVRKSRIDKAIEILKQNNLYEEFRGA
jgi:hypothetical protein